MCFIIVLCKYLPKYLIKKGIIMILNDQKEKINKIVGNLKIIADCL